MKRIIVATANKHKLQEIKQILSNYEIISMAEVGYNDEIEENGTTFFENALIKAKTVSKAIGETVLADDSGLCVDALGGAPSIMSARYANKHGDDKANREKLLFEMKDKKDRKARFVCCLVLYKPDDTYISVEGKTEGEILYEEQGENGFGYDSLFFSTELNKGFAVCSQEEKNSVSHRGKALKLLAGRLK